MNHKQLKMYPTLCIDDVMFFYSKFIIVRAILPELSRSKVTLINSINRKIEQSDDIENIIF